MINLKAQLGSISLPLVILTAGSDAHLLENGDFSSWESPTRPANWIVEDTTRARIERSDHPVHSIPFSCSMTRLVPGTGNNNGVKQFVPVTPGQVYTFSAWFYDHDDNARGGLLITWCDGDSTAISSTTVCYTDSSIPDWQRLTRTATAPERAVYAKCLLRVYGKSAGPAGGVVFCDDASFEAGGGGVEEPGRLDGNGTSLQVKSPANAGSDVVLALGSSGSVRLAVFDCTGSECNRIYSGQLCAGYHSWRWVGEGVSGCRRAPGVYFILCQQGNAQPLVRKLVLAE